MATTFNISLSDDQVAWIKSRKLEAGYSSDGDVVRGLIRREREKEEERLEAAFEKLEKRDLGEGPTPVDHIVAVTRKVRKRLLAKRARRT